jgi:Fe-Mn family superoxide dismutase
MAYELGALPYAKDALEPHIDAATMEIHHGKHHAAYVANLNKAVAGNAALENKPLDQLLAGLNTVPENIRTAVRNNGGGHWNHTFFWKLMASKGGGGPAGELAKEIDATFGSFQAFQEKLEAAGMGRFGSGWAWLVVNRAGKLEVLSTPNQDNPIMDGSGKPVLGVDVWEHAYYLKYQNRRADYLKAWWNVVNWSEAASNYAAAKK